MVGRIDRIQMSQYAQGSTISRRTLLTGGLLIAAGLGACRTTRTSSSLPVTSLENTRWFDGARFEPRPGWIVKGRFTFRQPTRVDIRLDLAGTWLVPPFADAHNHGIGTGDETRDRAMIQRYLRDGVIYMQSMGNAPLTRADRKRLGLDAPDSIDAMMAQGTITGYGGHPMGLLRNVLLPQGYFPGRTIDTLKDWRFYEIASEQELQAKWPKIRAADGDFIKFFLYSSDEYDARRNDDAFFGRRGLDPRLAPQIVRMAHADGLRAAAHVVNVADFRVALDAGVDIIAHLPAEGMLTEEDARRTARLRVPVVTTCGFLTRLARSNPQESAAIASRQTPNLRLLKQAGARIVIGSDDPADTTTGELAHLRRLGVFSDAELLSIWTRETPRAIFPKRMIGSLDEGYEGSFLALEGDPLADWSATERIRMRVKRGQRIRLPA
jgi:imidazolonepropionase-like amidohydrolase